MLAVLLSSVPPLTTSGETEGANEVSDGSSGNGKSKTSSVSPLVGILGNLTGGLRELKEQVVSWFSFA